MGFKTYFSVFLCIGLSWAGELSVLDDDILSPDLSFLSDSSEPSDVLEPELTDLGTVTHRSRQGDDSGDFQDIDLGNFHPSNTQRRDGKRYKRLRKHRAKENRSPTPQDISMTPVDIRAITWKPESVTLVDRCQRGLLRESSTWNETSCITCKCQSLNVECKRPQCPELECQNQVQPDGECCPKCPEKLCETADGRRFKHGAEWHMDDCTYCECDKGKILCSVEDCQIPACNNPIKVPGKCCPICTDTSCHASNGTHITSGEVWKEGVCTHCYCAGGERKCALEKCPFINCTTSHIPQGKCCAKCDSGVVDCVVSDWGSWGDCPIQECGGGMTRRFRSVVIPPRNGGSFCPHMSEAKMCPRLPCDVLPVCPVTEWSPWGHCTATCGSGRKMRSRTRAPITKATMTSLIDCSTTHFQETAHCYVGACRPGKFIIDHPDSPIPDDICYQVTWSEWSSCSSDCGSGVQKRHQVLIDTDHPRGHLCHLLDEYQSCQGQNCTSQEKPAVRCRVSAWSDWSPCSKTCGTGSRKTKTRTILQEPTGGLRSCPKLFVSKACKVRPCQMRFNFREGSCLTEDGHIYQDGDTWTQEPCIMCRCIDSLIRCQRNAC